MAKWIAREQLIGAGNTASVGPIIFRGDSHEEVLVLVKNHVKQIIDTMSNNRYNYMPLVKDTNTIQVLVTDNFATPSVASGKRKPKPTIYSIIRIMEEPVVTIKKYFAVQREYFQEKDQSILLFDNMTLGEIKKRVLEKLDYSVLDSIGKPFQMIVIPMNDMIYQVFGVPSGSIQQLSSKESQTMNFLMHPVYTIEIKEEAS